MRTGAMWRRILLSAFGAAAATAVLADGATGEHSVAVSLSVVGNAGANVTATKGQSVGLVARAALRAGDRLLIEVKRGAETRLRRVAVCPRSPCTGRWTEQAAVSDRFQALVNRGSASS